MYQLGRNQHKSHLHLTVDRARLCVGMVAHVLRSTNNPNYLLHIILNMYVKPAFLYSGDILQVTKNWIEVMEAI